MKNLFFTILISLLCLPLLKAGCTYESFAVGESFNIGNMLNWSTSEEIDNKVFIIEKSVSGEDFEIIGEVKAAGNSEELNTYRFLDLDARKGKSYYRLKQVDFDGEFSYSKTVIVSKKTDNDFVVSNINSQLDNELVELTIDCVKAMKLTYSIKDMRGDILQEDFIDASVGIQYVNFDLSGYPNGSYRLFLESGEEVETITVRKTRSSEDTKLPVAKKDD